MNIRQLAHNFLFALSNNTKSRRLTADWLWPNGYPLGRHLSSPAKPWVPSDQLSLRFGCEYNHWSSRLVSALDRASKLRHRPVHEPGTVGWVTAVGRTVVSATTRTKSFGTLALSRPDRPESRDYPRPNQIFNSYIARAEKEYQMLSLLLPNTTASSIRSPDVGDPAELHQGTAGCYHNADLDRRC